ncbi:MAG TPA: hypothetical protein VLD67_03995, partial [Vicinamibacterales bacterium]|nr:hypothetical protein [Vicinamibacterales bacterium]
TDTSRHLDEAALTRIWCAGGTRTGTHPHLHACAPCRTRYAELVQWLEGVRDDAHAEADAAFPPERLAAQQAQIRRRLEALERPARVIAFPRVRGPVTSRRSFTQRWIATAAAAGLLIGVLAGQVFDLRTALTPGGSGSGTDQRTAPASLASRSRAVQPVSATADDEALFYGELGAGVRRIPYAPLHPLDDMTPRVRDLDR